MAVPQEEQNDMERRSKTNQPTQAGKGEKGTSGADSSTTKETVTTNNASNRIIPCKETPSKKDKSSKAKKGQGPKVAHKDHYARINHLYGVANFLAHTRHGVISRHYARSLDLVAKKTVTKLTPALKRTICKKCHTVLVAGLSMEMRVENKSHGLDKCDVLVHTCLGCGKSRRFPVGMDRDYVVFSERESVVQKTN